MTEQQQIAIDRLIEFLRDDGADAIEIGCSLVAAGARLVEASMGGEIAAHALDVARQAIDGEAPVRKALVN